MIAMIFRWLLAVFFIVAGVNHFVSPAIYLGIMPPALPWPLALIYLSGVAEVAGGVGVLIPSLRRMAAWGLTLLLLAVFPANIYAAFHGMQINGFTVPQWVLWARLPGQFLFLAWVYLSCLCPGVVARGSRS